MYIYERDGWPRFVWDQESISASLVQLRHRQHEFRINQGNILVKAFEGSE